MPRRYCPKCDTELEYQEDEPDVGVVGGYFCPRCEEVVDADFDDGE